MSTRQDIPSIYLFFFSPPLIADDKKESIGRLTVCSLTYLGRSNGYNRTIELRYRADHLLSSSVLHSNPSTKILTTLLCTCVGT